MTLLAHIAGIPVEETALSFGPVLLAGGGIATMKLRERFGRRGGGRRQSGPGKARTPKSPSRHP